MSKTRPPSELGAHLGYWLRFVSNHVSHAFQQKVEARGVTVAEWAVLRQLWGRKSVQPGQLARDLSMTRGAVSKLVDRLARKGLLERTTAAEDRRFQSLSLSGAGKRVVPVLARLADENDAEHFGHLAPQQHDELLTLLREMVQRHGWKNIPTD